MLKRPFNVTNSGRVIENVACRYVEPGTFGLLLRIDDAGFGECWPVDGVVCVGRSSGCQITLDDPTVSRRHASIRPRNDMAGGLVVEDHRSANGVRVNGELIERPTAIKPSVRLHFGDVEMALFRKLPFYQGLCDFLRPKTDDETGFESPASAMRQIAIMNERTPVTAVMTRPGNAVVDIERLARSLAKTAHRAFGDMVVHTRLGESQMLTVVYRDVFDHELKTCLENVRWSPELPHVTAFRFDRGGAPTDWKPLMHAVNQRSREPIEIVDLRGSSLRPGAFGDWTPPEALFEHVRAHLWDFDSVVELRPWRAHYFRKRLGLAAARRAVEGLGRVVRAALDSGELMASRDDRVFIARPRLHEPSSLKVGHLTDAWRTELTQGWLSLEYRAVSARNVKQLDQPWETQ